jgi:hypothetical protein
MDNGTQINGSETVDVESSIEGKAEFINVMNDVAERAWAAGIGVVEETLAAAYDVLYPSGTDREWRVSEMPSR